MEVDGDIVIGADQVNKFFFMDENEEQDAFGASTKAQIQMSGSILKNEQEKVSSTPFL